MALTHQLAPSTSKQEEMCQAFLLASQQSFREHMPLLIQAIQHAQHKAREDIPLDVASMADNVSLSKVGNPRLLATLQKALDKPEARFRDASMPKTLDCIIHRGQDVLAIYPTGSGKSTLIWLPALISKRVTIMISLFHQLTKDILPTAASMGVYAEKWTSRMTIKEAPRIVVIQVEKITDRAFRDFVLSLKEADMLDR